MADVHSPEQRRKNMASIKNKGTQAEMLVQGALQDLQLQYQQQTRIASVTTDFYLESFNTAILVHGCFWHGHDCHLFKVPTTRTEFWLNKIAQNRQRDIRALALLNQAKTRQLVIWECALRGKFKLERRDLTERIEEFLFTGHQYSQISHKGFELIDNA